MNHVLVFNVGSTTLKYALLEPGSGRRVESGTVDRIGQPGGDAPDHLEAAGEALRRFAPESYRAIGHRVVQGGEYFTAPTRVDADSLARLSSLDALAPLHNPPARAVITAVAESAPGVDQVMVFDTAYFATLPPAAHRYAVDDSLYRDHGVRRYGAHGTSHEFVTRRAIEFLGEDVGEARIISLHLGGGASATASRGGVAVETSMGMTPLEGLVMATRCGDIDPSVVGHLIDQAGMTPAEVFKELNGRSGLLGLCGEPDMRAIETRCAAGDAAAELAVDVYVHLLLKYVGGYTAVLGGLDALVFTAGVGENSAFIRGRLVERLGCLGIAIDRSLNRSTRGGTQITDLTAADSPVRTLVVPTDEELAIARRVAAMVSSRSSG